MKHLVKLLSLGAALAASPLAHATLISIGIQQTGVAYNASCVAGAICTVATDAATPGAANFFGSFGTFNFSLVSATGSPAVPQGTLSSNSIQTSTTTGGTITIYVTEQGLTSPQGASIATSSFTSNLFTGTGSVIESTLFSSANQLYAGTQMASATFTTNGTSVINTPGMVSGTYSETTKYVININGAGSANDGIVITATAAATPEPSSLIMLGTGLVSAAGMLVRRRRIV